MPFSTVQHRTVDIPTAKAPTAKPVRAPQQRRVPLVPKGTPQWMVIPGRALKRGDTTVDKTMLKEWRDYVVSVKVINDGANVEVVWMTPQLTTWKGTYSAADTFEIWRVKA